jgi:hypothetical protein
MCVRRVQNHLKRNWRYHILLQAYPHGLSHAKGKRVYAVWLRVDLGRLGIAQLIWSASLARGEIYINRIGFVRLESKHSYVAHNRICGHWNEVHAIKSLR